ncbi:hypothetical protein syc1996_d [Synechococcus elongatus PCC 6301]|uniref:DUF1853 domain-containing protein n=2 Tax=Synechococcus elongatus TaxID=32046 RepID=A0A0H3KBE3_SYNP6|nr:hypothetical protein syc1996_d [Synechococcus elongatus PCC 6301]
MFMSSSASLIWPRELADVLWLLQSPAIIRRDRYPLVGDARLYLAGRQLRAQWQDQDRDRLAAEAAAWVAAQPRTYKLGIRAEALLVWALRQLPRFRLLAHQLQLRDGSTCLGELDFLIEDRALGRYEHWELALKFFGWSGEQWIGPDSKDQPTQKLERMQGRQLSLSQTPAFQQWLQQHHPAATAGPWQRRLLSRGFAFIPWGMPFPNSQQEVSLQAQQGWLVHRDRLPPTTVFPFVHGWVSLPRELWMSRYVHDRDRHGCLAAAASLQELEAIAPQDAAQLVVGLGVGGVEVTRGFLVHSHWPLVAI